MGDFGCFYGGAMLHYFRNQGWPMTDLKKQTIERIIEIEGGYNHDVSDSGGETKYGITMHTAKRAGYYGKMIDFPESLAYEIYEHEFWDKLNLDDISRISEDIAHEIADTGVNCGPYRASVFMQRALNVFNKIEKIYDDLIVDGKLGAKTMDALVSFNFHREQEGLNVLLTTLNCLQGAFYVELAEKREKDEKFIYGWMKNRVSI